MTSPGSDIIPAVGYVREHGWRLSTWLAAFLASLVLPVLGAPSAAHASSEAVTQDAGAVTGSPGSVSHVAWVAVFAMVPSASAEFISDAPSADAPAYQEGCPPGADHAAVLIGPDGIPHLVSGPVAQGRARAGSAALIDCATGLLRPARAVQVSGWLRKDVSGDYSGGWVRHLASGPVLFELEADPDMAMGLTRLLPVDRVVVRLDEFMVEVWQDGAHVASLPVTAGGSRTPTPVGTFRVTSRSARTVALVDHRIGMDHMVRFHGGVGFHSIPYRTVSGRRVHIDTPLGAANVSGGCIRMADEDAAWLFRSLPDGAEVQVVR